MSGPNEAEAYRGGMMTDCDDTCYPLHNANPDCDHDIEMLWSGYRCKNCPGWYCA